MGRRGPIAIFVFGFHSNIVTEMTKVGQKIYDGAFHIKFFHQAILLDVVFSKSLLGPFGPINVLWMHNHGSPIAYSVTYSGLHSFRPVSGIATLQPMASDIPAT